MASLRSKVEAAFVAALDGVTNNIYTGISAEEKVLPCVICRAVSAEDIAAQGGVSNVTVEVTTKATANADSEFDTICEAVKQEMDASDFYTQLNTSDLCVYGLASTSRVEWGNDGDSHTETRTIQIACAPKA